MQENYHSQSASLTNAAPPAGLVSLSNKAKKRIVRTYKGWDKRSGYTTPKLEARAAERHAKNKVARASRKVNRQRAKKGGR